MTDFANSPFHQTEETFTARRTSLAACASEGFATGQAEGVGGQKDVLMLKSVSWLPDCRKREKGKWTSDSSSSLLNSEVGGSLVKFRILAT
jgi:hypothetical protein